MRLYLDSSLKREIIGAGILGFFIAVFFLVVAYMTIPEISPGTRPELYYWLSLIVFPVGTILAMVLAYDIKKKFGARAEVAYQFYKFVLVGVFNTLIDISIYNALIVFTEITRGDEVSLFKGLAFSAAVVNSYFWNKFWTFPFKKGKGGEFIQFLIISLGGLGLSVGTVHVVVNVIEPAYGLSPLLWANVGQLLSICFATIWNFIGYKYFVFGAKAR